VRAEVGDGYEDGCKHGGVHELGRAPRIAASPCVAGSARRDNPCCATLPSRLGVDSLRVRATLVAKAGVSVL